MRFGAHVFADEREVVEALLAEGFVPVGREGTRHYRHPDRGTRTGGCGAPMYGSRQRAVQTRRRCAFGAPSPRAGLRAGSERARPRPPVVQHQPSPLARSIRRRVWFTPRNGMPR